MELTKEQAQEFQNKQTNLVIWTVTYNTADFGARYTARPTVLPVYHTNPEDGYLVADTLEEIRQKLPYGLNCLDRQSEDDPVIVEVWL